MNPPRKLRIEMPCRWAASTLLAFVSILPIAPESLADQPRYTVAFPSWVGAVAYSRDGTGLAVGTGDGVAHVLRSSDGRGLAVLRQHSDAVAAVAFTPDGRHVLTGSFDHTARLWDITNATSSMVLRGHRGAVLGVAASPDGRVLATAGVDTAICLWDVSTGRMRAALAGHRSWVSSLVFGMEGKTLVSGSSDGTVMVWDLGTNRVLTRLPATSSEVRGLAMSADGRTLAAGLRYGGLKTWTAPGWKEGPSLRGHEADVWAVAFHPASPILISGDGDWNRPGELKFWNASDGGLLARRPTSGEVLALGCSPDGRFLAVGCWNRVLEVWDIPEALVPRQAAGRGRP
jgi:WD40 repeat protein